MDEPENEGEMMDGESRTFAAPPDLFGKATQPFGARRLIAAQSMGMKFFKLNDDERAQLKDQNFVYDGMFWDAVVAGYLCICPLSEVLKAVRVPEAIMEKAMAWAEKHEIQVGRPGFDEITDFFGNIVQGIVASAATPTKDKSGPKRDGDALPGE